MIAAVTSVFVISYGTLMVLQFERFHVHAFDFGIFDQGLWLLSRFHEPFITVRGLHLFADHSSYVLALLVPVYWIAPLPEVLIVLTVVIIGAGAPLTYALARAHGASPVLSALVGTGYLLYPAVSWAAYDAFHPEYVVIPAVIGAMLLITKDRHGLALALIAVALLAKEDVALLVVPLGVYVALALGKRRLGIIIAVAGALAMLISFFVLLPHFSPTGQLLYSDRYDQFGKGLFGIAGGVITKPHLVLSRLLELRSIGYVAALLLTMPLALLAPRVLLIGTPALLANILSDHTYQSSIRYHYTTYLIVVVALAAALGVTRVTRWKRRAVASVAVGVLVAAVASQLLLAPNPLSAPEEWAHTSVDQTRIREALAMIPDGAIVSAWDAFVPHLTHRETVYEFPNPWVRFNYGPPDVEMPDPRYVEWIIMRTDVDPDAVAVLDTLRRSGTFAVSYEVPPVLLLHRTG